MKSYQRQGGKMSDNKRYYWLKLKDTFFEEKTTKFLRKLPDGDKLVITYLKMQLKSLKANGIIKYDRLMPSCEEELSLILDEDINIVKFTIRALLQSNAIEILEDNSIYMIAVQELIGKENGSAERVRRFRENQKLALHCNTNVQNCNTEIEKEIDIEKEIELEIEKVDKFEFSLKEKLKNWFVYKKEKGDGYTQTSAKILILTVIDKLSYFSQDEIISAIDLSISNNWKGIVWEKAKFGYKNEKQKEYECLDKFYTN